MLAVPDPFGRARLLCKQPFSHFVKPICNISQLSTLLFVLAAQRGRQNT